ncbi:DUF2231 domain-containing protein [Nonomuraea indica]|uniref:DUF2231 domain-containing protein n=1 Tax=Nonomuraea indica TaxID=1581193 RepID=UPI000C7C89F1|nr:DUF2231 domain-containing protein [Nonomuraea indica]
MFDQVLGLPAHPLIVHFAVVLTPLLALLSVAYAALPRLRGRLGWAVVLLSVAAPIAVFAARQSGESLKAARFATAEGELATMIATHQGFATPLLLSALGLGVSALLLVLATTPARAGQDRTAATDGAGGAAGAGAGGAAGAGGDRFGRAVTVALSALTVVLALVAAYYAFRAGDSGARAVWE